MFFSPLVDFLIASAVAIFLLLTYIKIWNACHKFINNKIIKAVLLGLITPFFSFGFIVSSTTALVGYWWIGKNIDLNSDEGASGALVGVIFLLSRPVSILLGIAIAILILTQDILLPALKNDVKNFLDRKQQKNDK